MVGYPINLKWAPSDFPLTYPGCPSIISELSSEHPRYCSPKGMRVKTQTLNQPSFDQDLKLIADFNSSNIFGPRLATVNFAVHHYHCFDRFTSSIVDISTLFLEEFQQFTSHRVSNIWRMILTHQIFRLPSFIRSRYSGSLLILIGVVWGRS